MSQSKSDASNLDRLHQKVKGIESNMKSFKLKERQAYEQLAEEEAAMTAELEMWRDKFQAYENDKGTTEVVKKTVPGPRSNSVGLRLYKTKEHAHSE